MKITIRHYFERTRQIADFVPVKAAIEASAEVELEPREFQAQREAIAADLRAFCEREVERTLMGYTPCCIVCGGKQIWPAKDLTKAGLCNTCNDKQLMEARGFAADNARNRAAKNKPNN